MLPTFQYNETDIQNVQIAYSFCEAGDDPDAICNKTDLDKKNCPNLVSGFGVCKCSFENEYAEINPFSTAAK